MTWRVVDNADPRDGNVLVTADARRQRGLTAEERENRRRRAICSVLQKTDRILLGSTKLAVDPVADPDMAPGWTTGAEIYWQPAAEAQARIDADFEAVKDLFAKMKQ